MAQLGAHFARCFLVVLMSCSEMRVYAKENYGPPGKPVPCFRTRTKYDPLNMDGVDKSKADRPEDCQTRCTKTTGCAHFTWFDDGGCHLQDHHANRERATPKAMSGPVECGSGNFCYRNGIEYTPNGFAGHKRTDTIDAEDCQLRCANVDGCAHFSWYADGGCHIHDANAEQTEALATAVAGGRDCDATTTVTTTTVTTTTLTTTSKTATVTETTATETVTKTKTITTTATETVTKTTKTITESTTTVSSTTTNTTTTATTTTLTSTTETQTTTSASTTTSSTSPPDLCLLTSTEFRPLDMNGQSGEKFSSPYLCQSKCRKTEGCVHFSWWGRDGGCHLQDGSALPKESGHDVLAGPTTCTRFAYCFENRHKWEPLNMKGGGRTSQSSATDCQKKCQTTSGCKHFSFWSDGGCHLQDDSATRKGAENQVVAGPVFCDYEWDEQDGYLPETNNLFVGHLKPDQAKAKCINLGCSGLTFEGDADEEGRVKVYIKSKGELDPDSKGKGWVTFVRKGVLSEDDKTDDDDGDKEDGKSEDGKEAGKDEKADEHGAKDDDKEADEDKGTANEHSKSEDSKDDGKEQDKSEEKGTDAAKDSERLFSDSPNMMQPVQETSIKRAVPSLAVGIAALVATMASVLACRSWRAHGTASTLLPDEEAVDEIFDE